MSDAIAVIGVIVPVLVALGLIALVIWNPRMGRGDGRVVALSVLIPVAVVVAIAATFALVA